MNTVKEYDYLQHFNSEYCYIVYLRTYSRWLPSLGRREMWPETVERYMNFMKNKMGNLLTEQEYSEIEESILKIEVMPSMRLLQFAGPAAERDNICAYNCCFIGPETLKDFADIAYILMNGTGIGFSCEKKYISQLPVIQPQTGEVLNMTIPDDRAGWAESLLFGMTCWYEGKDVIFDYSKIRPKGARLNTTSGRASGPEPLKELHEFTKNIILSKQGQQLSSIDVHDIVCKIGTVIVAGGTRRSAIISLSDLNDEDMRTAKMGEFWNTHPHRCMSNNSAVYYSKPDFDCFKREWDSLVASGSGERGIFNKTNLSEQFPQRRVERIADSISEIGTNPCITEDTWIFTSEGPRMVKDLFQNFLVPFGDDFYPSNGFYCTGNKKVYRLTTFNGYTLDLTENHPLISIRNGSKIKIGLEDLEVNDLLCLSNHRIHSRKMKWYQPKENTTSKESIEKGFSIGKDIHFQLLSDLLDSDIDSKLYEIEISDYYTYVGFIRSILEFSGILDKNSLIIQVHSLRLCHIVQRMLYRLGVISISEDTSITIVDDNIEYLYNLVYPDNRDLTEFYLSFSTFCNTRIFEKEKFEDRLRSIQLLGKKNVYDTTVSDIHEFCANGIRVSNCGEIYLLSRQFCNLSTVVCRPSDDEESLKRKIRIATIIGTYQACLTDFGYISPKFKENVEKERLLGVSMTGQHDSPFLQQNHWIFQQLKELSIEVNKEYAQRFGICQSSAITCVKPEGTTSEMVGTSSGIHARYSPYYVRRIRIAATDPLAHLLIDQQIPYSREVGEDESTPPRTYVFSFPQKSPECSRCIDDMSAIDQLEYWKVVKQYFTEHNPSTTVKVKPEEWDLTRDWLLQNWEIVGGLAFLPTDSVYKLAPFEKISKEQYEEMIQQKKYIKFGLLSKYEKDDTTDVKTMYACVGDNCSL